jgi:hypothetical protein
MRLRLGSSICHRDFAVMLSRSFEYFPHQHRHYRAVSNLALVQSAQVGHWGQQGNYVFA